MENIGDAFIRVHARGEHIGDDLVRELDGLNKEFDKAGAEHADIYENRVRRGMRKGGIEGGKEAVKGLRGTLREMKLIGEQSGGQFFQGIRRTLISEIKDSNIGNEMARRIEEQFVRSGGRFSIVNSILGDSAQMSRIFGEAEAHINRLHGEAIQMNNEFDRTGRTVSRVFERSRGIRTFTNDVDRLGETTARIFGKGSRSEFLNVIGRSVGLVFRLGNAVVKTAGTLVDLGRSFTFAFQEGARGFSVITTGFAQMGFTAAALAPAILAGAAAFAVLAVVVPGIISAFSLLAGIVTALAGSIAFALVGSLSALMAILGPAAAAAGVLGLAFIGMDQKAKNFLKETLRPLGAEFKILGQAARTGLFSRLPETVSRLKGVFSGLRPLVKEVGIAIADVGVGFAKAMQSPGFRAFRNAMFTFLPGAVRKLGEAFRHTLGGLGGLFRGMIPFMNDVLDGLVRITRQFSEWANSARGQNQIEDFFRRVSLSMKAFGGFLKEGLGLIGDLLSAGRGTGDSIFTSMANQIREWRKALKEDPDILRRWFRDAKRFADSLGDAAIAIGRVLDKLDSAQGRKNATDFFNNLTNIIDKTSAAFDKLDKAIEEPGKELQAFKDHFRPVIETFDRIDRAVNNFGENFRRKIGDFFSSIPSFREIQIKIAIQGGRLVERLRRAWDGIRNKAANLKATILNSPLIQRVRRAWDAIRNKAASLRASIANSGLVSRVKGWWDGIRSKAASLRASIPGSGLVSRVKGWWDGIRSKAARLRVSIPGSGLVSRVKAAWDGIRSKTVRLRQIITKIFSASGGVLENGVRTMATGGVLDGRLAHGGFANSMQNYGFNNVIGESGREAIVPLDRPLSLVDPSVRALSAFAQGLIGPSGPSVGVDASGWTIVSNSEDPVTVARETLNHLTAASY